jgi:hypothetical protein
VHSQNLNQSTNVNGVRKKNRAIVLMSIPSNIEWDHSFYRCRWHLWDWTSSRWKRRRRTRQSPERSFASAHLTGQTDRTDSTS